MPVRPRSRQDIHPGVKEFYNVLDGIIGTPKRGVDPAAWKHVHEKRFQPLTFNMANTVTKIRLWIRRAITRLHQTAAVALERLTFKQKYNQTPEQFRDMDRIFRQTGSFTRRLAPPRDVESVAREVADLKRRAAMRGGSSR
jgi:hypothetical protein